MLLTGTHAIIEALQHTSTTGTLYINNRHTRYTHIVSLAKKRGCTIQVASNEEIKKKGGRQGVLFIVSKHTFSDIQVPQLDTWLKEKTEQPLCILILDHILDPQNYGAIIRSSFLLEVDLIIAPKRRMAPENDIAFRSSAGAMSYMPRCYVSNLNSNISLLQKYNIWVYALDLDGSDITNINLPDRCAFILGSEHKGVSHLIKQHTDDVLTIPSNNKLDSFNVGVSAALTCFEYYRQHRHTRIS